MIEELVFSHHSKKSQAVSTMATAAEALLSNYVMSTTTPVLHIHCHCHIRALHCHLSHNMCQLVSNPTRALHFNGFCLFSCFTDHTFLFFCHWHCLHLCFCWILIKMIHQIQMSGWVEWTTKYTTMTDAVWNHFGCGSDTTI